MFAKLIAKKRGRSASAEYDDDFFKETRMSFGDHLEELRWRMWRAIKGLGLCLVIGFILDTIGDSTGNPWIGIGKPMLRVITDPVEEQVKEFYHRRTEAVRQKVKNAASDDKSNAMVDVRLQLPLRPLAEALGTKPPSPDGESVEVVARVRAADVYSGTQEGEYVTDARKYLTGLGVMEAFMVYIKVSLLCGVVIACPWIFWQMWAFVGAGLYPHEKKLVHVYLPFSILLFLGGCVVCQFIVMPKAVAAMLSFYDWINVDPDLRLNEWLSFAILMPLVFGVSFQTPLVMLFLNRIGLFGWDVYLAKWRYALFVLAITSAVLTPSTDIISMLWLFVPTFGLYMVGVLLCYILPEPAGFFEPEEEEVGV